MFRSELWVPFNLALELVPNQVSFQVRLLGIISGVIRAWKSQQQMEPNLLHLEVWLKDRLLALKEVCASGETVLNMEDSE